MEKIKIYMEILEAIEETLESIEPEQVEEMEGFTYGDWMNLLITLKNNGYKWDISWMIRVAELLD